jgi:hypothetical protein
MAAARVGPKALQTLRGTLALFVALTAPAAAQERPAPAAEFTAAWVGFADDGVVSESLVGATARWYLLPRISVGPEVDYVNGQNHSHFILTGNVTFDVVRPKAAGARHVTPFVVVGGGLFQTRESFVSGTFTSNEGAFTAGGGVRASVSDRVTVGIDARVGWELHLRISGIVGVQLGRSAPREARPPRTP